MGEKAYTILILDDDRSIRESFSDYFEDMNYNVLQAVSAEDALKMIPHSKPDGAIIDIRLPGMDGNAFIQKLKKIHPDTICIICTGSPEYKIPGNIDLPSGVAEIFTKPVSDLKTMESILRKSIEANAKRRSSDE